MCLSAPISFTLSAVLALTSVFLITQIRSKCFLALALIPGFFALQQAAEGFVWLQLPATQMAAKNVFLFFAYSFWPLWMPFSLWLAEEKPKRRQFLAFLIGLGLTTSAFLFLLIVQTEAVFHRFSIYYRQESELQRFYPLALLFYVIATVLPIFVSSLRHIRIFGLVVFLSALTIYLIDSFFFTSLWCFFVAAMSPFIFLLVRKKGT